MAMPQLAQSLADKSLTFASTLGLPGAAKEPGEPESGALSMSEAAAGSTLPVTGNKPTTSFQP